MKKNLILFLTICLLFISTITICASDIPIDPPETPGDCSNPGGHNLQSEVGEYPTCTTPGWETIWCLYDCGYYIEKSPLAPLGHDYKGHVSKEATCNESGIMTYQCSRCTSSYDTEIKPLGHNYNQTITKQVTCLENGLTTYTCSRCLDYYEKVINALGHNYIESENVEPTCTDDGHITKVCKNCNDEIIETISALGHDVEYKVIKEATCIEHGTKSGTCKRCLETVNEDIPIKSHIYPNEWTIVKDASAFAEGLKIKKCQNCDSTINEIIPKEKISPLIYIASGSTGAIAILYFFLRKSGKVVAKKTIETVSKDFVSNTAKEATKKTTLKPLFEKKAIATCIDEKSELYRVLKIQKHLKITEIEYDNILAYIEKNKPDLLFIDISTKRFDSFDKLLKQINDLEFNKIKILISKEQLKKYNDELIELKTKEIIENYDLINNNPNIILVTLILPTMKPKLQSGESLKNIGMVADALGIKGVSKTISLYLKGRGLYSTATKEGDLNFIDMTSIVSTIASILGLDKVSEVTSFILALNTIKSNAKKKIGGNEASNIKSASDDIINVIKNNT